MRQLSLHPFGGGMGVTVSARRLGASQANLRSVRVVRPIGSDARLLVQRHNGLAMVLKGPSGRRLLRRDELPEMPSEGHHLASSKVENSGLNTVHLHICILGVVQYLLDIHAGTLAEKHAILRISLHSAEPGK